MKHTDTDVLHADSSHAISSGLDFPVVGLGASAGGIEALLHFFEKMPGDCGMAFVVILHLSPEHESNVDQILQRATRMPVLQVNAAIPIQKDHVYVISPAMHLQMADGSLQVSPAKRPREKQIAIDLFFRTLADAHKTRAFALVLSGTGTDGSIGLARIKEQGGLTLAQLPDDAEFDGMPRSAIERKVVDFVLPAAEMPRKLLELWRNARRIELPDPENADGGARRPDSRDKALAAEAALTDALRLLANRTGHDFKHYKRATVLRRLERRMQVTGVTDMPSYLAFFEKNPDETGALLSDMLIGVTNFFRDREAFEALELEVIPHIVKEADGKEEGIRVWTPACSTGEEAYSLAIALSAEAARQSVLPSIQVFATDVDERALATGRQALYPESISTDVPPAYLRQFFNKEGTRYRIAKKVRDTVLFAQHNILRDPPFSRLQLITCRNLLIYLDRRAQREALKIFHAALRPGGYLFLGTSETADAAEELFTTIDKKNRIFRASAVAGAIRPSFFSSGSLTAPALRPPIQAERPPERRLSYSGIYQRALEQYGPAAILIDQTFQILHMSHSAGRFLRHVGGDPSHNVLALIHPPLRLELRTTVLQALKTGGDVDSRPVAGRHGGREAYVRIAARAFKDDGWDKRLVLLTFDEVEPSVAWVPSGSSEESKGRAMEVLENEVQMLTEQLQHTVEHSDASTEELKASNEELQAINEELRSATEELETSKEELQSINEELVTVNYELKTKVDETVKINDDLQNLISSSDIATIFVDRGMRVKWFTPKSAALFNLIAADSGRSLTDITHRLEYSDMMADTAQAFESLRLVEREVRSTDNRWYLARILPYRTAEDRIDGAVLNFVDITDRRQAEERLREGLERLRLVAESTTDFAIITMDKLGRITGWNRAAEVMFGYQALEVEGQPVDIIFTPEDRSAGVPAQELRRAFERGHADDDRWHVRKDGSRFFCSGVVHPMVDGQFLGYAKIARDLTDKRIREDEQQSHLQRTQASNVLKDEFIAIMSHELRHPLNLIQLNADLLARVPGVAVSPPALKAVDAIRRSVNSQAQIIADLLDLSRVKTGKLKLNRVLLNLNEAVAGIVQAVESQAQEGQILLQAEGLEHKEHEALMLDGDVTRIEQIVWNLLNNAIKFTPPGGTVTVSLTRENGQARLDVRDTGIGIPAESLDRVFDMFSQVDRQHNERNRNGLGIGLALVAQLAQAHGGRVAAASEGEGLGASFSLWLPLVANITRLGDASAAAFGGRLDDLRILLVDDSKEVLDVLSALCEMKGARVTTAGDGAIALDYLRSNDFDVLLSDLGMPNMDGYTLLAALRKSGRNADLPAIALTGYGYSEKARAVGFTDQLCKPVPVDELLAKLYALSRRGL